jgi:hypothetical protein
MAWGSPSARQAVALIAIRHCNLSQVSKATLTSLRYHGWVKERTIELTKDGDKWAREYEDLFASARAF